MTPWLEPEQAPPTGIRRLVVRWKWPTVAGRIATQLARRVTRPLHTAGATHRNFDLGQSVAYIDAVYDDYLAYARLRPGDLRGMSVLELGPGDNFGVALRFLAAGAERVAAVDRFVNWRDPEQQRGIYRALIDRLPAAERAGAESIVSFGSNGRVEFDERRLRVVEGVAIEDAPEVFEPSSFDLIISRAVLEHVHDTAGAFEAMDTLLRPGGIMAHKIDLRDHGLFTAGGQHPLTFLTIPDRLYRWMGERHGFPNRKTVGEYLGEMRTRGYEGEVLVSHVAGRKEELFPHREDLGDALTPATEQLVQEIRPGLLARYRDLPTEELVVAGMFLVGRKPASPPC